MTNKLLIMTIYFRIVILVCKKNFARYDLGDI